MDTKPEFCFCGQSFSVCESSPESCVYWFKFDLNYYFFHPQHYLDKQKKASGNSAILGGDGIKRPKQVHDQRHFYDHIYYDNWWATVIRSINTRRAKNTPEKVLERFNARVAQYTAVRGIVLLGSTYNDKKKAVRQLVGVGLYKYVQPGANKSKKREYDEEQTDVHDDVQDDVEVLSGFFDQ